jgi:hypothetical protein
MELATKQETSVTIPDEFKDVFDLKQNTEGITVPRLPQIKIIHRGQLFEMPDESKIESFEGIILDQHAANAWWEKDISETGGNAPPDCFSMDGQYPGEGVNLKQNENCKDCKQNQFGSDPKTGKGKACKNMKRLHVLMEGSLLPRRITTAPSSIASFETYLTTLTDRGIPYPCCVTVFSLAKKVSESFEYSEVKFNFDRILNPQELDKIAELIKTYKQTARKQEIRAEEYMSENNSANDDIPF